MESTGDLLYTAHDLYTRSSGLSTDPSSRPPIYKVIGIILAVCSGLFIGVSFVLKKVGLLKANKKYNEEAGEGYGYLRNVWWWSGMTLMIIGEICNFVAYAFVDAILVTPLGALSVVVTTILSAIFLKERLSFVGKVGCFNCIIGSVVIVINAPEQSAIADIQEMKDKVIAPGFLVYMGVVIVGCIFTALWAGPRYGKRSMMVYLTICSLIGGLSVVCTQGLGSAIVAQAAGKPQFNQWFLYVVLVFVVATLLTEIIYLNKALNLFNAALVTPTYYVYFTSATIVTSAILFQGFKGTASSISTVVMGFLQICSGVVLLQLSKSAKDVPDTAVFTGDLDQVRTVAEQEEHEYEPRADTIRSTAGILRTISTSRQKKEAEEAKHLMEERMDPIGENEQIQWDGIRRRKTVLEPGQQPLQRRKTLHPPLGMSYFPDDDNQSDDGSLHPGFFSRFRSGSRPGSRPAAGSTLSVPLSGLTPVKSEESTDGISIGSGSQRHIYGLPPGLQRVEDEDTSYKPHEQTAIHWASDVGDERARSQGSLAPPKPPPHLTKRQFSFQNVFHRMRSDDGTEGGSRSRPISRGGLSFSSRKSSSGQGHSDGTTEEERLGLVKGDSANMLGASDQFNSPPEYSDDEWQMPSRPGGSSGKSPVDAPQSLLDPRTRRQRDGNDDDDHGYDNVHGKDFEKDGSGGAAFV